MWEAAMAQCA